MTTARASALAFLTAAATLSLQVLVHRMVSAKLLNNYAFLVISLTMLGFALSGVILGSLLARPDLSARWVYSADLFGSALGALVVIPAISWVGVEWSALGAGFLLLAGTLLLARPGSRLAWAVAAAAALVLLLAALKFDRVFDVYYPEGSILAAIRDPRSGVVLEHTAWDPLARVEVSRIPPLDPAMVLYPSLLGSNRTFLARVRRMITLNNYSYGYAVDYDGARGSLAGIEETIYSAAYHATSAPAPRALVVGVGGGF